VRAESSIVVKMTLALLAVLLLWSARTVRADGLLSPEFLPSDLKYLDADAERIGGTYPGLLLTPRRPRNEQDDRYRDEKNDPYKTVCYGYIADFAPDRKTVVSYKRRFIAHTPDREGLD